LLLNSHFPSTQEMASGYGLGGGRSRCFPFWQEFNKCYAMADKPEECVLQRDDYLECLHHTKEIARAQRIAEQQKLLVARRVEVEREAERQARTHVAKLGVIKNEIENKAPGPAETVETTT